jgi:hypothetical protein
VFAVLGSMGMAIIYGLKVNLSIALGTENPKPHTGQMSNKTLISEGGFISHCTQNMTGFDRRKVENYISTTCQVV